MNIAENTKDDSDLSIVTCSLIISAVIVTEVDECISVETNLFFERIRISNLIRNLEIFRIRIRILFVVRKFSNPNPNPNIRDSVKKIRIRI